jgi:non-specific serine/threonine protein kinase
LRRLSPFGAGFTLDAASVAVAADGIAAVDVAPIVWSLVDTSLVTADLAANDTRYRLPEPVRDYARTRLHERNEAASVARRVAQWCLGRAAPWGTLDRRWLAFMGAELDNVRAILVLLCPDDEELAQQLVATIGQYHDARGTYREGAREVALAARAFVRPTRSRIAVLNRLADLQLRLGALDAATRTVDEAEALRAQLGGAPAWDDAGVARARGELQLRAGDDEGAEATARRALAEAHSTRSRARLWNLLGLAIATRDLPGALEAFREELAIYERLGYEVRIASASGNVAELSLRAGDVAGAARHQLTTLQLGLEQGWDLMVAYSMIVAARLAAEVDDWRDALALAVDAAKMVEASGIMLFDEDRAVLVELVATGRAELGASVADAVALAATGDPAVGAARARKVLERHLA